MIDRAIMLSLAALDERDRARRELEQMIADADEQAADLQRDLATGRITEEDARQLLDEIDVIRAEARRQIAALELWEGARWIGDSDGEISRIVDKWRDDELAERLAAPIVRTPAPTWAPITDEEIADWRRDVAQQRRAA